MSKYTQPIIDLVYAIAKGSKKVRNILTPFVGLIFFAIIVLFIWLGIITDRILNLPRIIPAPFGMIFSIFFIIVGLVLMLWSVICFLKVKGTPVPINPPPVLVTYGFYKYVRNPMLTGVFTVMLGIGFFNNSCSFIFFYLPVYIFLNYIELKLIEEPELEKRLGKAYVEYKKITPMFFPFLKAGRTKELK